MLAVANIWRPLLWTITTTSESPPVFIDRVFLPLFYPIVAYSYLVLLAGLYWLLRMAITSQQLYRWQSVAIVVGTLMPMTTGALFVTNNVPLLPGHIDPTPVGFAGLGVLYGYSVYRFQLLDVVPIGREKAWDEMDDAVVTLDQDCRVVDCNAAARELFDAGTDYVGMPARTFFGPVSEELLGAIAEEMTVDTQLSARIDGEQRHFSLSASPIGDGGSERDMEGQVLVLRENTSLKRREQESELLREVQSRVLRHNLRNELNAIRGNAELLAEVVDEQYDDRAKDVIDASDKLLSISRKARLVEEIVDTDVESREYDLSTLLEQLAEAARAQYDDVTIDLDVPERCRVDASPKLDAAIENLIENAIEHGQGANPHVRVSLTGGETPRLSVTDNGSGIPEQEVKVLEDGGESQLTHGSGLGLWFVKLVADRSDAELSFDTGPEGTDVTLQFG
jgi:signal transduction histidine kinase